MPLFYHKLSLKPSARLSERTHEESIEKTYNSKKIRLEKKSKIVTFFCKSRITHWFGEEKSLLELENNETKTSSLAGWSCPTL